MATSGPKRTNDSRADRGTVVVVLGVHRSGTSLTTRMLQALGVRLGDHLIPGRGDNRGGFFEDSRIVQQSRRLDELLGVEPFRPGGLILPEGSDWWEQPAVDDIRDTLVELIREEAGAGHAPFGFKDPRTLYLLPLWLQVFDQAGVTPHFILALRDPVAATLSMSRRGIGRARAEAIWAGQISTGIRQLPAAADALVHYERWFSEPRQQLEELATALGRPMPADDTALDAIRTDLRHEGRNANREAASPLVEELYGGLSTFGQGRSSWEECTRTAELVISASDLFAVGLRDDDETQIANLKRSKEACDEKIRDLKQRLNEVQLRPCQSGGTREVDNVYPRHPAPYKATFPGINTIRAKRPGPGRSLKVCIATEDIVGPIRNGGIGTTYTHLALLLAEAGHDTTILYLRGDHCEDGEIGKWVDWYAERGVRFVPVPLPTDVESPSNRWIKPMYALYRHLRSEHFDLVHVSEWRGSGYLCQLAKAQGLAFADTIFCVKTSSPWLWNRENGLRTLDQGADLIKMHAERRSVELADLVVGGSAYLLRWMLDHGYRLPPKRTFVQPNVLIPVELPEELRANRPESGSRVPVQEIVFFGRLEHRKGLDLFCEAINKLVSDGVELPPITFMGKFGSRIPYRPEVSIEEYITEQAGQWPVQWQILSDQSQSQALTYLHGRGRLAVMPSVAENSTLTVYEATHFSIPFIATKVGGTAELVYPSHRKEVLAKPHPLEIAKVLGAALKSGAFVAAPRFDNDSNLRTWLHFHATLGTILHTEGWPPTCATEEEQSDDTDSDPARLQSGHVSVCLVLDDDPDELIPTIDSLLEEGSIQHEFVIVDNGSKQRESRQWLRDIEQKLNKKSPQQTQIIRRESLGVAAARNSAACRARGSYLLFLDARTRIDNSTLDTLSALATHRNADVLLPFFERVDSTGNGHPVLFLAGDPGFSFFDPQWRSPAMLVRKETFDALGGFTDDYRVPGEVEEFLNRAVLANKCVESVPEPLVQQSTDQLRAKEADAQAFPIRTLRPYVEAAPLCYQPILMASRSLEERRRTLRKTNERLRPENRELRKTLEELKKDHKNQGKANRRMRAERDKLYNELQKARKPIHQRLLNRAKSRLKNVENHWSGPLPTFIRYIRRLKKRMNANRKK